MDLLLFLGFGFMPKPIQLKKTQNLHLLIH